MLLFIFLICVTLNDLSFSEAESLAYSTGDTALLSEISPYWGYDDRAVFLQKYNNVYNDLQEIDHIFQIIGQSEEFSEEEFILWERVEIENFSDHDKIKISALLYVSCSETAVELGQVFFDKSRTNLTNYSLSGFFLTNEQYFEPLELQEISIFNSYQYDLCGFTLIKPVLPQINSPSLINLSYTLSTFRTMWGDDFIYYLPLLNTVKTDTLEISIISDKNFEWTILDYSGEFIKYDNNNNLKLIFTDLPAFTGNSEEQNDPNLVISSFNDLNEIGEKSRIFFEIDDTSEILISKAVELTYALSKEEAAKRIYDFVSNDISYIALEWGWKGYYPSQPSLTLKNGYGDCKDKVILLLTLFHLADINAWPVLLGTRETEDIITDPPAVFFNHVIATVEINGDTVFCDPAYSYYPFGYLPPQDRRRRGLIIYENNHKYITIPSNVYKTGHIRRIEGSVNDRGLADITVVDSIYGYISTFYTVNLLEKGTEIVSTWFLEKLPGWNITSIWSNILDNRDVLIGGRFFKKITDDSTTAIFLSLLNIDLPQLQDIWTQGPLVFNVSMNLEIPDGFIIIIPENHSIQNEMISADFTYSFSSNTLKIDENVEIISDKIISDRNLYLYNSFLISNLSRRPFIIKILE